MAAPQMVFTAASGAHTYPVTNTSLTHTLHITPHQLLSFALAAIFMLVSLWPHSALAFETELAVTPTQTDDTSVQDHISGVLAASVIAPNAPITKPGLQLERRRLAYAPALPPAANKPQPQAGAPLTLQGEASYYSRAGCLGCNPARIMANGQPLNDGALTMAIGADKKHLVGRKARVTSLATGKSATVTITDTGGFHQARYGHRVADLTVATKQAIGMAGGVGQVRVEIF